jgi:phage portal protein BeeE
MFLYGNAFVQYIQDAEGNVEIEILDPVTVRITREGESS